LIIARASDSTFATRTAEAGSITRWRKSACEMLSVKSTDVSFRSTPFCVAIGIVRVGSVTSCTFIGAPVRTVNWFGSRTVSAAPIFAPPTPSKVESYWRLM
jgi:hypothetical protein